jgi:hypothetical protein
MKKTITLFLLLFILVTGLQAQKLIEAIDLGVKTRNDVPAQFGFLMPNDVQAYKLVYETTDPKGNTVTASGLAVFPTVDGFAYPITVYQHGTVGIKSQVPSNESAEAAIGYVLAANNYVVIMPDYLGFGENEEDIHPYIHAETQASAAVDMLFAVQEFAGEIDFALNDQLFVTGYSQGGHAAAALHQVLEADFSDDFTVTGSAPMSGPYDISGAFVDAVLTDEPYNFPQYLANTFVSYNYVYELYDSTAQIFKQPYADMVDQFRDGEIELNDLGVMLNAQLATDYGASINKNMFHDSVVTILTERDPAHPLTQALMDNDVYDWAPQAPTRLYYCIGDDQVNYRNSVVADSVMNVNGAPDVTSTNLGNLDHGGCIAPALLNGLAFFASLQNLVTDIDEVEGPDNIKIYPNPARDKVQLTGVKAGAFIQLFNSSGQLVKQARSEGESFTLDLPELTPGLFWIRIVDGRRSWTKEIVVK